MALVLLVLTRFLFTTAATCNPVPFALSITDVQVDPEIPDSFMRGIPAQIGTPPQHIVMLPWAELNNTWIYDQQTYCDPTIIFSDTICQVRRGHPYSDGNSTSFVQSLDIISAGGSSQETNAFGSEVGIAKLIDTSLAGIEFFNVASTSQLSRFPIGIPRLGWDAGYTTLHALGMGTNSTYMNNLRSTGRIGARVWSIFWGRMWTTNNPLDGQVVLGGYDESKVIGQNHTQALNYGATGCWTGMKVNIADVLVNFRNGKDASILQANTAIPTCIVPHRQLLLEVPGTVYDNFEKVTNTTNIGVSYGLHWSAHLFDMGTQ
ncbi:uncharacterized protein A1O9_01843 [Exophiala aquamarina CBS 119918]|uniref:Peptidase A1 domain-containing protein n=1 Tax=Exophiala aquamarina CBS 119918 TaxID=1182545 RepID=A0A072Q7H9_9EURO|nr:uncharacterized protein A1O9_01843 [Exophiala aquamarina CBS 119918]KEF63865.1 hypothetical protein A1O9_01843 [Exophiala aquamarina CBS 119918]